MPSLDSAFVVHGRPSSHDCLLWRRAEMVSSSLFSLYLAVFLGAVGLNHRAEPLVFFLRFRIMIDILFGAFLHGFPKKVKTTLVHSVVHLSIYRIERPRLGHSAYHLRVNSLALD